MHGYRFALQEIQNTYYSDTKNFYRSSKIAERMVLVKLQNTLTVLVLNCSLSLSSLNVALLSFLTDKLLFIAI